MALVLSKTGSIQLAIEDWRKSLAVIRGLVALDSEDKFNRHYLGTIVAAGGTILIGQHKPEAALKQFDEARSIYLSLRDAGGASWFEIASAAQCTVKMAEVELLRGNATAAGRRIQSSVGACRTSHRPETSQPQRPLRRRGRILRTRRPRPAKASKSRYGHCKASP